MYGIEGIGTYIPSSRIDNLSKLEEFALDSDFLTEKIGVLKRSKKLDDEETSDLCVKAFGALCNEYKFSKNDIDVLIVITQNPDRLIPHTSSIVHKKLSLNKSCACFDISLGCSGYVYGLSIISSFLESNGFKKGILFTADPYSKIINENDKNTSLLFGDAATATLISEDCMYYPLRFSFGTFGEKGDALTVEKGKLTMDGREIYNFTSVEIPKNIKSNLELNEILIEDVDFFALHPGSKYILKTLKRKLKIPDAKIDGSIEDFGNTVSSTIPIELSKVKDQNFNQVLISGFGVGLSWATTVLRRK